MHTENTDTSLLFKNTKYTSLIVIIGNITKMNPYFIIKIMSVSQSASSNLPCLKSFKINFIFKNIQKFKNVKNKKFKWYQKDEQFWSNVENLNGDMINIKFVFSCKWFCIRSVTRNPRVSKRFWHILQKNNCYSNNWVDQNSDCEKLVTKKKMCFLR